MVSRAVDNLGRLASALRELKARIRAEGVSDEDAKLLPVQLDALTFTRMELSTWRTDAGAVDVLVNMPDRTGRRLFYEDLAPNARLLDGPGFAVRAAGLADIIASKEWADRPKDHDALGELHAIQRRATNEAGRRRPGDLR
ncbi:MAG: hypothetical protein ACRDZW_01725 [Acidimicrobiales bacterium]